MVKKNIKAHKENNKKNSRFLVMCTGRFGSEGLYTSDAGDSTFVDANSDSNEEPESKFSLALPATHWEPDAGAEHPEQRAP